MYRDLSVVQTHRRLYKLPRAYVHSYGVHVDVLEKRKNEIKILLPKSVPRVTVGPRHKEACENTMDSTGPE